MTPEDHSSSHSRAVGGSAAYRIERVYGKLLSQGLRILRKRCHLTLRQWWIIADMAELKPETPTDLARVADIDKGLLSRNLKVLVESGHVVIERCREDQRRLLISLTDAGRAAYRDIVPVMRARNLKLTFDISENELDIFMSVLDRIEAATADDHVTDADIARIAP